VRPADLPAASLSQVNYAFAVPDADGTCQMDDPIAASANLPALRQLRSEHPGLELILSVAGYGFDEAYLSIVQSPEAMRRFSAACIELLKTEQFDGIDLDWEYPRAAQTQAFTALLREFRGQLDALGQANGRRYRLTIAAPAGSQIKAYDLPAVAPLLDWFNVMTYDYYGTWLKVTGFNAPLYTAPGDPQGLSADSTLSAYLAAGVPAEKLLLGIPFYGRAWSGAAAANDGLFQPYQGALGKGSFDFREIQAKYLNSPTRHWHETAQVPWLFDPASGTMISYDDPQSVGLKAAYARRRGLGGVMIWQIAGDDANFSLLQSILKNLIP
jgi:chitinase